jgi:hypothetical protein
MTSRTTTASRVLIALEEAAVRCGISPQKLLDHAAQGDLDLCIKVPRMHLAYVALKNYVANNDAGGPFLSGIEDLIYPKKLKDVIAVLITRHHCLSLLQLGHANVEFFPGGVEIGPNDTIVRRTRIVNFLPGLEERRNPSSLGETVYSGNWASEGGEPPMAAVAFGMSELTYWAERQSPLFDVSASHNEKMEPWCPLNARCRRLPYSLEYWICLYPDETGPTISQSLGISRPENLTITAKDVFVHAGEIDSFLLTQAKSALYQRVYGDKEQLDALPVEASSLFKALNSAAIGIWGGTRPTDKIYPAPPEVNALLHLVYGIPDYMASYAAGIIRPDFAENHFSPIKKAMFGGSFRSSRWHDLLEAHEYFWEGKDASNPEMCASNAEVQAWLTEYRNFPSEMARHGAMIIRPDNAVNAETHSTGRTNKPKKQK